LGCRFGDGFQGPWLPFRRCGGLSNQGKGLLLVTEEQPTLSGVG
jgi:hypothetical protein